MYFHKLPAHANLKLILPHQNMSSLFSWIPNFLTLCNLLMGCLAIMCVVDVQIDQNNGSLSYNNLLDATVFVGLGMLFDFADGLAARLLNVHSKIGKELDSLADVVTFGVAPAFILFSLLSPAHADYSHWPWGNPQYVQCVAFAVAMASAFRLAKFNVDDLQEYVFKGLPVPTNALLLCSLPWIVATADPSWSARLSNPYWLLFFICLSSWLPVSKLPFISLKTKGLGWAENKFRYMLLAGGIILFVLLKWLSIPLFIAWYAIISFISERLRLRSA